MTTKEIALPPEGDRTPRGRRGEGTVPALSLSSSNDGLPAVSPTSAAGKTAIVEKAFAFYPCYGCKRSFEDLEKKIREVRERAVSAAKLLCGRTRCSSTVKELISDALCDLYLIHRDDELMGPPAEGRRFRRGKSKGVQVNSSPATIGVETQTEFLSEPLRRKGKAPKPSPPKKGNVGGKLPGGASP